MKKVAYILIVVGLVLVINSLVHSIVSLWGKQDLVRQAQMKLDAEKKENTQLKKQLTLVQSKSFIETEARDKLFLVKPDETDIILPQKPKKEDEEISQEESQENWQKWLSIFN